MNIKEIQNKIKQAFNLQSEEYLPKYYRTGKKTCLVCGENNAFKFVCYLCRQKHFKRRTGTYLEGMDLIRQIRRLIDKHTCQNCKKVWQEGMRRFDIHHLDGNCGKFSRSYDSSIILPRLITLCHKCHLNLPEVRNKISQKASPRPEKHKIYQKNWHKNRYIMRHDL